MADVTGPRWVSRAALIAIHHDQIRQHGGHYGILDKGLVDSALARARNRWEYEPSSDLADLAAAYGHGIVTAHPFVDGNKRVAFLTMYIFLSLNELELVVPEPEVVVVMRELAAGELDEAGLARWVLECMQNDR